MQPSYADPLKKREEFVVKLRKQKKDEILKTKRKKMMEVTIARTKLAEQQAIDVEMDLEKSDEIKRLVAVVEGYLPQNHQEMCWQEKYNEIMKNISLKINSPEDSKDGLRDAVDFLKLTLTQIEVYHMGSELC